MTTIVTGNKAEFRQIVLNCCNVLRKNPLSSEENKDALLKKMIKKI